MRHARNMPPPSHGPSPDASAQARFCRACGYDLRTLAAGRCTECGRAFDPADPRTVHARPPGTWARAMLRLPGAWHYVNKLARPAEVVALPRRSGHTSRASC